MRLDIVIPAHNEEHRIGRMLGGYRTRLRDPEFRFVVALDACSDRTAEVVRDHMTADPRVQMKEFPKLGKGGVIRSAFSQSRAEYVGFVDADGATPPGELQRLADAARHADGAIASRRHPAAVVPVARPIWRRLTSAGFAMGVRTLLGLPYDDTQCGAKVLRRESVNEMLPLLSAADLSFDVDLLLAARKLDQTIIELPTVWIDRSGSRVRPIQDARRMGGSLIKLSFRERRPGRPFPQRHRTPQRHRNHRPGEVTDGRT